MIRVKPSGYIRQIVKKPPELIVNLYSVPRIAYSILFMFPPFGRQKRSRSKSRFFM